ncbi:MAG: hypothetical protein HZA50_06705 [Planctomycetes bacterium]|nr:hypothetical protein [Planctomycetota bacterium]
MAINGISGLNASVVASSFSSQQAATQEAVDSAATEVIAAQQNGTTSQNSAAFDSLSGAIESNAADAVVQANNTQAMGNAQLITSAAQSNNLNIYSPNKEPANQQQQQLLDLTNNAAKAANAAVVQINLLA